MGRFKQFLRIIQNKNPEPSTPGATPGATPHGSRPVTPNSLRIMPKSAVIVPLYIYPLTEESWEPLHTAIADHPDLDFVIVINPNSGPGEPPEPDTHYSRELPRLNRQPNVTTVGYCRTEYCKRSIEQVYEEVAVYAGWSKNHEIYGNYVEGIFLDEAPNHYTEHVGQYLESLSAKIKATPGILGKKLVIHNPGTVPDPELTKARPDVTAVFEESYARFRRCGKNEQDALNSYERKGCTYILHSVPADQVKPVVHELRERAEYIFVTDLSEKFYESFGPSWNVFIEAMQDA